MVLQVVEHAKALLPALTDFAYFCREVLGYTDMITPHEELCRFLQHDPSTMKLILMPRYSFKSCISTIGYSLWRLAKQDSLRILIYSDATTRSEAFLNEIKHHIMGLKPKSRFRDLFGAWEVDPKRGVWNQTAIVVKPRQDAHAEPSVDTAGLESSKVGAHYDLIIFDDLVTRENVTTKDLMDKVSDCYKAARSLLKPGGEILVVGTRWHFGDMYGRLLSENETTKQWAVFLRDGEVGPNGEAYPFERIGLTKAFLEEQKASQGSYLYSCLYRLSPQDDETAVFKAKDFTFYNPARTYAFKQWVSQLYITCVLDAIPPPTSDHGDDAAITVVGTDANHVLYLLEAVAGRLTPEQQLEEVFALHAAWKFKKFGLETNAFQRILKSMLEKRLQESRKNPKWEPFSIIEFSGVTQGNKEQRIQGLQPWHEQGLLKFPGERLDRLQGVWSQLAYQMLQFPHSPKDDLLDSLAYHLQLKQVGFVTPQVTEIPYTSAAWFELEQRKEELREMARRPRWRRRPLPGLSFS